MSRIIQKKRKDINSKQKEPKRMELITDMKNKVHTNKFIITKAKKGKDSIYTHTRRIQTTSK
jgi:hypothetical protein